MRRQLHCEPQEEGARDARETQEESSPSVGSPAMMEYHPTFDPHATWQSPKRDRGNVVIIGKYSEDDYTPLWNPLQDAGEHAKSN